MTKSRACRRQRGDGIHEGGDMTPGERAWWWRYSAEDRRRTAAARGDYLAEAAWSLLLALLRVVRP